MWPRPHFRAHIKVRSTEDGGRHGAFTLYRYRPDLSFALDNTGYYGAVGAEPWGEAASVLAVWLLRWN